MNFTVISYKGAPYILEQLAAERKTDVLKKKRSTAWPQLADAGVSGTTSKSPLIRGEEKGSEMKRTS